MSRSESLYTAERIGAVLARRTFDGMLCVVDRCTKLGDECDLLVVTKNLRAIDVEIKISRADLKADRRKDKWFALSDERDPQTRRHVTIPREWPRNVWKHYYVVAAPVWRDELLEHCQPRSGVITIALHASGAFDAIAVKRRATPNRKDTPLSHEMVVDIARLASLRMWDAYKAIDRQVVADAEVA